MSSNLRLLLDKVKEPNSDSESEFDMESNAKRREETQYLGMQGKSYYWVGKDYANTFVEDFKDLDDHQQGDRLTRAPVNLPFIQGF